MEVAEEEVEEVEGEEEDMGDMEVVVEEVVSSQFSSFSWPVRSSWPVFVGTQIGSTPFARPTLIQVLQFQVDKDEFAAFPNENIATRGVL